MKEAHTWRLTIDLRVTGAGISSKMPHLLFMQLTAPKEETSSEEYFVPFNPTLGMDMTDERRRTPVTPEKRLDIRPDTPVRLQTIPVVFWSRTTKWLLNFGKQDDIKETSRRQKTKQPSS